jgi:hypothetical protein
MPAAHDTGTHDDPLADSPAALEQPTGPLPVGFDLPEG